MNVISNTEEKAERAVKLARDVMRQCRDTLMVNLRFMDMAFSKMPIVVKEKSKRSASGSEASGVSGSLALSTDGMKVYIDPVTALIEYRDEKENFFRNFLHMILHCVLGHPFADRDELGELACDIEVENIISELELPCVESSRSSVQRFVLEELKRKLKNMKAENIYAHYAAQGLDAAKLASLRKQFLGDSHDDWPSKKGRSGYQQLAAEYNEEVEKMADFEEKDRILEEEYRKFWLGIAKQMMIDLAMFSGRHGKKAGSLTKSLKEVIREKYDYADFLKNFCVEGETLKVNQDEFDYIFYTYGMEMYDGMPLIEPLEYADTQSIREFVIAIDTSESVSRDLVYQFINKTYNIMIQQESFFSKVNVHIIQCDADIQEDEKITSREEFDEYLKTMKLHGFGGTDFRPVFEYVDDLIEKGEFTNLKGLIYFTDGRGYFPERMPEYNAAFVFVDNDEEKEPRVPAWAMKLLLRPDEI